MGLTRKQVGNNAVEKWDVVLQEFGKVYVHDGSANGTCGELEISILVFFLTF